MKVYFFIFGLVCYFMVLITADVNGPIPYQSSCSSINTTCSNQSMCTCAKASGGEFICTQQMSCDYAQECSANNTCEKDGSTCVNDPRCPDKSLCYSIVLFSPDFCPPLPTTDN